LAAGVFLRQFLNDQPLMQAHLEPFRAILERFAHEDSLESAAVMHGALTAVLWRFVQSGIGKPVLYEELCSDPVNELERLFNHLELPYGQGVAAFHEAACLAPAKAAKDYRPHAVVRNSLAMSRNWRTELDQRDVETVRAIWECFDIPLYRGADQWSTQTDQA